MFLQWLVISNISIVPFFVPFQWKQMEKMFLFFKDKVVHNSTTLRQIFKNIKTASHEKVCSPKIPG